MTCGCASKSSPKNTGSIKLLGGALTFKDCGCGCGGSIAYEKFMISLLSAVIFYIVAHPGTFKFVRSIIGDWVSSAAGCPSASGLILHSVVFMFIVWGLMYIKNIRKK